MNNTETKHCQNCKASFTIDASDFAFYEKMGVPAPGLCPECRMKRKLLWRNEVTLYKRNCLLCDKSIIAMYHPTAPYTVFCEECYKSDKWDARSFAQEYEPEKLFMEQLKNLIVRVPKEALYMGKPSVDTPYQNFAGGNKSCYLVFNSPDNEESLYSRGIMKCKNVVDAYFTIGAELCYEAVNANKSSRIVWGQNVLDSLNSYFLLNCTGVQNCFACVNLRHKSYHFFNEPLSKEEWKQRIGEITGSYAKMQEARAKFEEFTLQFPRREHNNLRSTNSSGEYIFESKSAHSCFEVFSSENCKYSFAIKLTKDSYDAVGRGLNSELLLETVAVGEGCSRVTGSWGVGTSHNIEYSYDLRDCEYCLGCVGLRHAKYSILNKQYTEAAYHELRDRIIGELKRDGVYGLYLPPELSPWAYNETLAQEFSPLSKQEALGQGFRWQDDIPQTQGKETLKPENIPDHIKEVQDNILNEILVCVTCKRNYRLIHSELEFYRRILIPIPRQCFFCRHADRIRRRGPFKIFDRTCARCGKAIKTNFVPERPEIVYCEQCYNAEVA